MIIRSTLGQETLSHFHNGCMSLFILFRLYLDICLCFFLCQTKLYYKGFGDIGNFGGQLKDKSKISLDQEYQKSNCL